MRRDLRNSQHLATISFDGRFWDAYLEFVDPPGPGLPARGRIAFSAADAGEAEPVRTSTIFIEDTVQEVVARAREFKTHQLVGLLRSAIPLDEEDGAETGAGTSTDEETAPRPEATEPSSSDAEQGSESADLFRDQGEPADGP